MTLTITFIIFLLISLVPFSIMIYNFFTVDKLNSLDKSSDQSKLVSILIPARNEEENINSVLQSCINQNYQNLEIIVLDDNSEDKTGEITNNIIKQNPKRNIKLIESKDLPAGWKGKNWACHNLGQKAKGEYFLFIDADVTLGENAINSSLLQIQKSGAKMITAFPTQIMKSFGEKIFVDLVINWTFFSLFPFKLTQKMKSAFLAPVIGQFILVEREAYFKAGGHEAVKNEVVEDRCLGINFKNTNSEVLPLLGLDQVFCRMYRSSADAFAGFEKNSFKGSRMNPFVYIIFLFTVPSLFYVPFILSFFDQRFLIIFAIWILGLSIKAITMQQNLLTIFLFPIQVLSMIPLGISSMIKTYSGKTYWRGRQM